MMHNAQNGPLCDFGTTQADQGLRCPLTESMATQIYVVYVDEQKIARLDCIDTHNDLDLHCPQNAYVSFSCLEHHMFFMEN